MLEFRRIIGPVTVVENIAVGGKIREVERLRRRYGKGRWRKVRGLASVELTDGEVHRAELHWYEAHGIGRKEMKVKRLLD
ncbi:MAG TPA: hypothetical protein VF240_18515 [Pyrinomonadaceae bacterium]